MNKENMVYILIIISIMGILSLYFIKNNAILNMMSIKDVKYHIGESVRTQGTVTDLYKTKQGHMVFTISGDDKEKIKGVIFKDSVDLGPSISLEDRKIDVVGKVDEYNDELEIIVKEIKFL